MFANAYDWFRARSAKFQRTIICLTIGFVIGGATCRSWRKAVIDEVSPETRSFGWVDKPAYVEQLVRTFARPYFSDAGKKLVQSDADQDAFLWLAVEKQTGRPLRAHDQDGTGCCVGEGWSSAIEVLSAVEIELGGEAQEFRPISAAAIYALSREVGDFLGDQDGSTGADAAKAVMDLGAVSCEEAKDDNTTGKAHAALARKWGRTGLPKELKALAAAHRIKTASRVRTPEEVRAALANGYPVPICSSVGFEGNGGFRRDAEGFCKMGGSWPHCMCIVGYRKDKRAFLVLQSWGDNAPSGPKTLGQPDCSFWIDWKSCQRIVTTGECYAISSFDGYKARQLPLFIGSPVQRELVHGDSRRALTFDLAH